MKKINLKKIALAVLVLLVLMQLFRIDKTNQEVDPQKDFIAITQPSPELAAIFKTACYDCHSNKTTYPWYSNLAPVSWWLKHHVDEGKEHLNFSIWADYNAKRRDHKLEEIFEEVEEGEMPLSSYTWMHSDANLTAEQKEKLVNWVKTLR